MADARVIDGKRIANLIYEDVARQVDALRRSGQIISLATIQVGEPKDVVIYAKSIEKMCERTGVKLVEKKYEATVQSKTIRKDLLRFSEDPSIHGILIFSPLPQTLTADNFMIFDALDSKKDVEGRTFMKNYLGVLSPTAKAVIELLLSVPDFPLKGKKAVVIGNSDIVGKPVGVHLSDCGMTVTFCNIHTQDLAAHVKRADVVVASAGKPCLVKGSWIKKGAVVIDVGENFYHGKLMGDVDFQAAKKRAYAISPVPGGVGPVTNVMLIKSLLRLCQLQKEHLANY